MVIQTKNHIQLEKINGLVILTGYHFNNEQQQRIADFIDNLVDECAQEQEKEELSTRVPVLNVPKREVNQKGIQ